MASAQQRFRRQQARARTQATGATGGPQTAFLAQQAAARAAQQRTLNLSRTVAAGNNPTFHPYTPWSAGKPPTGTYDPAIDAQEQASHRGLSDLVIDNQTATTRDLVDYGLKREDLNRQQDRGLADFGSQRATLARSYARLGNQQSQQINAAGVGGGGAALQAAAKRAMNERTDAAPILTGEDRLRQDTTLNLGQLGLGYGRQADDRATAEARARREDAQFAIDAAGQRGFMAGQVGYTTPGRGQQGGIPSNEHVGPLGNHTQVHVINGVKFWVRPDGTVAHRKRL